MPTDRGDLVLTCPACRLRWNWAPPAAETIDRGEDWSTILPCPGCRQRLQVPTDRGDLVLPCPVCRTRWDWPLAPDQPIFIGEDRTALRDPDLAAALRNFEMFEQEQSQALRERAPESDLWDVDLDGPRR